MRRVVKLGDLLAKKTRGIVPNVTPEKDFELYSVPSFDGKHPEIVKGKEIGSNKQIVDSGTVLLCKINPRINRAWYVSSFSDHTKIASTEWLTFPTQSDIEPKYLSYFLGRNAIRDFLSANASGVGGSLMRVKGATIQDIEFSCPSLEEQRSAVAEIEKQFSRLDKAVANLQRVKANLKRYKAAVLKAAVDGLLSARRDAVRAVALEDVAAVIDPHPSHRTPSVQQGGIPYVGLGDINEQGQIDFENARKVSPDVLREHRARYVLREGDFIFGKIGTIGRPVLLQPPFEYALSANVVLVQPNGIDLSSAYAFALMSSPQVAKISKEAASATTQAAFGIKRIRKIQIGLPSVSDQRRTVDEIDRRFSIVREVEAEVEANLQRAQALRQSVLSSFFVRP